VMSLCFLRLGYTLSGGCFCAGLIMSTGIILQYTSGGILGVDARPLIRPQAWIALGLMVAGAAAMAVWWVGKPLLAAHAVDLILPLVGTVHLSGVLLSALAGSFRVVGAPSLMSTALRPQRLAFTRQ